MVNCLYLFSCYIQARCSGHTLQLSLYDSELVGYFYGLLVVNELKRGCNGLTPTHWAFKTPLWVGAGTEMRTQYPSTH